MNDDEVPKAPVSKETNDMFGAAMGKLCEAFLQVQTETKMNSGHDLNGASMKFTLASTGVTYEIHIRAEPKNQASVN